MSYDKELEQLLLESTAKIERLLNAISESNVFGVDRYEAKSILQGATEESNARSLAMHDADVIGGYQELLDKRLARQQSPLSTRAIAMGFANEHIKQLRNSVKEGE
jgi:hypothetical protein